MEHMKTKLGAIALSTSVVFGAGITLSLPVEAQTASAQPQLDRMQQREERLQSKVDSGSIPQERADKIRKRMANRGAQREAHQADRSQIAQDLATTLGTTADNLIADLRAGTSLANLAEVAGVDINVIIDQIEVQQTTRIDQAVANGRIAQAHADENLKTLRDQITTRLNGERPEGRHSFGQHGRGSN